MTTDLKLEEFLPYRLAVLSNTVSTTVARAYDKRFSVSIPEWRVIAVLGDAHLRGQALTQRELTEATLMDKVAVNRACKVLEERGLIAQIGARDVLGAAERERDE